MDRTADFWDAAFAAGVAAGWSQERLQEITSARLLPPVRKASDFRKAATDCVSNLRDVWSFLAANRRDYLEPGRSSAAQKDKIEEEVVLFCKACSKQVNLLQEHVNSAKQRKGVTGQAVAHQQGVVLILTEKLAAISSEFDRLRNARSKRAAQKESRRRTAPRGRAPQAEGQPAATTDGAAHRGAFANGSAPGANPSKLAMLEAENDILAQELRTTFGQAREVERTVQDIAVLNSMFSEQIFKQATHVEVLYAEAIEASQRVEAGNLSLDKAIKLNSSTRLYIVLVFAIATFGLLFLDRYSSRFGPV